MFKQIMVPVDLRHQTKLTRALTVAADLANKYGARIIYVGVTSSLPGALGHNPTEYKAKLEQFAAGEAAMHGINASAHMIVAHDPAIDLDPKLTEAAEELGCDLVVMTTHLPDVSDYVWASHGGHMAAHSSASVMLVRG